MSLFNKKVKAVEPAPPVPYIVYCELYWMNGQTGARRKLALNWVKDSYDEAVFWADQLAEDRSAVETAISGRHVGCVSGRARVAYPPAPWVEVASDIWIEESS